VNRAYIRPPLPQFQALAVVCIPFLFWGVFSVFVSHLPMLQSLYWTDYVKASLLPDLRSLMNFGLFSTAKSKPKSEYQVLYCYKIKGQEVPVTGDYIEPMMKPHFAAVPMRKAQYANWLRVNAFGKRDVMSMMLWPVMIGSTIAVLLFLSGWYLDQERHLRFRSSGRQLRGPELVTANTFTRKVKGDGLGFRLDGLRFWQKCCVLRIQQSVESQHLMFVGDQGAGKTQGILNVTDQAEALGETCVIYDPHREFIKRYYNPHRGDIILGLDERCAHWDPSAEIDYSDTATAEATALSQAASLFPGRPGTKEWFFTDAARRVLTFVMVNYQPNAGELAELLTHPDPLIDAISKGTDLEELLTKNAGPQRAGVHSTLAQCLFALKQIPEPDPTRPVWSAREWAEHRKGWIFLTSTQDTREAVGPLQRLWIDSLIMRLLSMGSRAELSTVRVIVDELPALGELSQLKIAVAEARKSGLTLVLGFQGRAQIKAIYGDEAEGIFSAPYTKIVLRTGEPESGEWLAKMLGKREMERIREHRGPDGKRSYTTEQREELVVYPSELAGLENRHGYLRYANYVVPITVAVAPQRPDRAFGWIPRVGTAPVILPMPNLQELKEKEAANRMAKAEKHAEAVVYAPPSPRKRKAAGQTTMWKEEAE
jgi:hypothetical protein